MPKSKNFENYIYLQQNMRLLNVKHNEFIFTERPNIYSRGKDFDEFTSLL